MHDSRRFNRGGFTLVEMVLVLVILAVTAGLVIPLIGSLRTQTDRSSSAFGSAHIIENFEAFRLASGRYPERMDSLLENDGGGFVPYSRLADDTEAPGNWFNVEDLDSFTVAQYARSLNRAGITTVMDHDTDRTDANASGRILRPLLLGDRWFAVLNQVNSNSLLAAAGVADLDNDDDYLPEATADLDLSGHPDVKYVAFGLGSQCEVVGQLMANAPMQFNAAPKDYSRFIIIFVAHESGAPALLRTVVDSRRIDIGRNVSDFRTFLGGGG